MPLIGVRGLRDHTTEVLRRIREENAEYIITCQGQPVAILQPVDTEAMEAAMLRTGKESAAKAWDAYEKALRQGRESWPKGGQHPGCHR
jgi:antitoxin (DNA-binding transcriptional repressor) of toxin-antitoxin stability system